MVPSKVYPNWKQARSSNDKVEEDLFFMIEWHKLFQFQIKLQFICQKCHLETYYECLDKGDAWRCSIPT